MSSFCPVTVSMHGRALMKILKSYGDMILPCAIPMLKVIVALFSSFGASLTVAPLYVCSNKWTMIKDATKSKQPKTRSWNGRPWLQFSPTHTRALTHTNIHKHKQVRWMRHPQHGVRESIGVMRLRNFSSLDVVTKLCLFVCLLLYDPKITTSPPALGSNPWEYIHLGRVAVPAVLPKVHHGLETLYVSTEVHTPHVDGLVRISGLTQAPVRVFVLLKRLSASQKMIFTKSGWAGSTKNLFLKIGLSWTNPIFPVLS